MAADASPSWWRGAAGRARAVLGPLDERLRAALVVASIAMLATHHVGWVRAIDGYAFAVIGNLTARMTTDAESTQGGEDARVVVLALDQRDYDDTYGARSPLDRCALYRDLRRLYAAGPRLVVIDLDLAPVVWVEARLPHAYRLDAINQRVCQDQVDAVLQEHGHKTVLMAPVDLGETQSRVRLDARRTAQNWRLKLQETGGVRFGDPEIFVDYGLVVRSRVDPRSLVGEAAGAIGQKHPGHQQDPWINPAKLRRGVRTVKLFGDLGTLRGRIVFFGGTWDVPAGDAYLTPIGELYGVEVHAGALASLDAAVRDQGTPWTLAWVWRSALASEWRALFVDVVVALILGGVAAWSWERYFDRVRRPEVSEYSAVFWVFLLAVLFVVVLGLVVWFSLVLLRAFGVWASPVPVALGVALEIFLLKSVEVAKHLLRTQPATAGVPASRARVRWRLIRRRRTAVPAAAGGSGDSSVLESVEVVGALDGADGAGFATPGAPRPAVWWKWVVVGLLVVLAVHVH